MEMNDFFEDKDIPSSPPMVTSNSKKLSLESKIDRAPQSKGSPRLQGANTKALSAEALEKSRMADLISEEKARAAKK